MEPNPDFNALADEHRQWLSAFDTQHLRNWEKVYRSDYEAAMTEASMRRMLQAHRVEMKPNEKFDVLEARIRGTGELAGQINAEETRATDATDIVDCGPKEA